MSALGHQPVRQLLECVAKIESKCGQEPKYLWELYILLVEIEAVFRSFKNDLGIRPVYHRVKPRIDALKLLMARMNKEFGEQPPPKLVSIGEGHMEVEKL